MRTPAVNPKIIATLPIFFSVFIATTFIWYFNVPKLTTPFVLGIIAGGLVDLDNRLTGRLKNIVITVVLFSIASLSAQITYGAGLQFILTMTLLTFVFTLLGAVGLRYRTFAFGTLAVATYTTLSYTPDMPWVVNPFMILCGTLLYSTMTLILHIVFPHRPVQENMAAAYSALGGYLDAKAEFFDPDEAEQLENRQIDLAMKNTAIIEAFNRCRNALFYRMRGQHRHPRTSRMLRYYFTAQDIHERISSAHMDYRELAEKLKNTDLIFRIHRL
ncbi:FUSC family membrane protein, partial [Neisseria dentiae]|uniref:FUSC family membrane protein n=4 Tax=Neisseria dentiae TaxID=194197 RepID=UPI0035A0F0E0